MDLFENVGCSGPVIASENMQAVEKSLFVDLGDPSKS